MKKQTYILGLGLLLASLTLAGCGGGSSDPEDDTSKGEVENPTGNVDTPEESVDDENSETSDYLGSYYGDTMQFSLSDNEDASYGVFWSESSRLQLDIAQGPGNQVYLSVPFESYREASIRGADVVDMTFYYETGEDSPSDIIPADYSSGGTLSIEGEFEEEVDGEYGWQREATDVVLRKVPGARIFFGGAPHKETRYRAIDTNGDDIPDTIDTDTKDGDEWQSDFVTLLVPAENISDVDLAGAYGGVNFRSYLDSSGELSIENATYIRTFHGDGTLDLGEKNLLSIYRNSMGATNIYSDIIPGVTGLTANLNSDGTLRSFDGERFVGAISENLELISINSIVSEEYYAEFSKELMIKLPNTAPSIANKTYSVVSHGVGLSNSYMAVVQADDNVTINFSDQNSGSIVGYSAITNKITLQGALSFDSIGTDEPGPVSVAIAENGATEITLEVEGFGVVLYEGFFNEDASLGVFRYSYVSDEVGLIQLGITVLVQRID